MRVNVTPQVTGVPTFPLGILSHYAGSALPLTIVGIPYDMGDGIVAAVKAVVTNADGAEFTADCIRAKTGEWCTSFAATCFPSYGRVESGFKIAATLLLEDGSEFPTVIAVGDFELKAASPSATPGDPTRSFVTKGSDVYLKSFVDGEGAQHYVKQSMQFDARVGWGAVWTGDYILVDGEFVEVNQ